MNPVALSQEFLLACKTGQPTDPFVRALAELPHDELARGLADDSRKIACWINLYNAFPSRFERRFRVERADPRIHFALNCGAVSCPAIRFYSAERLEAELDLATRAFLASEARHDPAADRVDVSPIFRLYQGDFGGTRGILDFLRRHEVIPEGARPRLGYLPYDFSPKLGAFE